MSAIPTMARDTHVALKTEPMRAWGLTLGVVAVGVEALVVSPVLKDIAHAFGVGPTEAGWTVTAYGLALAVSSPLFALGGQRYARKTVMAAGMTMFVIASVICALADSFFMLLLSRALCGAAAGAYLPTCYAYVADSSAYEVRGRMMGRVMAGWSIALILGIPLGAAIAQALGWPSTFLFVALMGMLSLTLIVRLPAAQAQPQALRLKEQALDILRSDVPLLLLINFLDMLSFYGVYTFLGSAIRERLGLGAAAMGLFVLFYGLGLLASTLNAWVLDRWGKVLMMQVSLLGIAALLAVLGMTARSALLLPVTMILWGWFQGLVQTSVAAILSQAAVRARGLAMACLSCSTYLAVTLGSAAGGTVYEIRGFDMVSTMGALCALSACLMALPLLRRRFSP